MVDQQEVRDQLARILESRTFQKSESIRRFLKYVVIEDIEGRANTIKSYTIGTEALGRPSDFDVASDGIVRTTANRLRSSLEKYYLTEGRNDPIQISLPLGGYIPEYSEKPDSMLLLAYDEGDLGNDDPPDSSIKSEPTVATPRKFRRLFLYVASAIPLLAAAVYGGLRFIDQCADVAWQPPTILIPSASALTADEHAIRFARSLPTRLSDALTFYDINSVVRVQDFSEAQNYVGRLPSNQGAYVVTAEVDTNTAGIGVYWQLVDARTGAVLWSSEILKGDGFHAVDIIVHELVGENAVIRSVERRKLPLDPIAGYVCVTHTLNEMITLTEAKREWMSKCLSETVGAQADYAQAWALLALMRVEDSIAAADEGDHEASKAALEDGWRSFRNAERLAPGSWFTLRARMALEFQEGDFKAFRASIARAITRLPENARERIAIGERLFALGEYEEASTIIKNTINLMTVSAPSDYLFLAAALYRRGENRDALKLLLDQPVPQNAFYWSLVAATAGDLGDATTVGLAMRSLVAIRPTESRILEASLRNRHFRNEFIEQIRSDFNRASRM